MTMSLCFSARGPGLKDKGFPGSQSRAQTVTLPRTLALPARPP